MKKNTLTVGRLSILSLALLGLSGPALSSLTPSMIENLNLASHDEIVFPHQSSLPYGLVQPTDEYIIMFRADTPDGVISALQDEIDQGRQAHEPKAKRLRSLNAVSGKLSKGQLKRLANDPKVKAIEANQTVKLADYNLKALSSSLVTTDSWGLDRLDQQALPLSNLYHTELTGQGTHAYVLDSGIHHTHYEFSGRAQWDFTASNITDGNEDGNGHGTHMAGVIGSHQYGVASGVNLHGVKVVNNAGVGTLAGLIEGIEYVTNHHQSPAVAVLGVTIGYSQALNDAIAAAIAAGVSFSVPSGDETRDACGYSPSSVADAITVASSGITDNASIYSNTGACVDVYAPGLYIKSTWHSTDSANNTISHSPISAAFAAGSAALVRGNDPTCSVSEVKNKVLAYSHSNVLSGVPAATSNLLLSVPRFAEGLACAPQQYAQRSCASILQNNPSSTDGVYEIDPAGTGQPFAAYCDMTHQGGGWTLVAGHRKGLIPVTTSGTVLPDQMGVITADKWQAVRDNMTDGMMFIDEDSAISMMGKGKLDTGNCLTTRQVDDLANGPLAGGTHRVLFHSELSGCTTTGRDYTMITLNNNATSGATLYQQHVLFDIWPYEYKLWSGRTQNELWYFVK